MTGPFAVVEQDGDFVITSAETGWQVVVLALVPGPYSTPPPSVTAHRYAELLNAGYAAATAT